VGGEHSRKESLKHLVNSYLEHPNLSVQQVENPTYEFQKRNISSIQENLSSIQNYQGLSFLPVTFPGLADLFPPLGS
jgi:hypothetical protein